MTCPITFSCYKVVDEGYISTGKWTFLYEDLHESFVESKQTILDDEPTKQTQALRAFYALEYMYFQLLPKQIRVNEHLHWKHNFEEQYERSCEGLELLIHVCEQTERRIFVDKGTFELSRRDASMFTTTALSRPLGLLQAVRTAAELLHAHMRGSNDSLGRMGEWLGKALIGCNQSLDQCLRVIEALYSISIHNPVSPCSTTTRSPA